MATRTGAIRWRSRATARRSPPEAGTATSASGTSPMASSSGTSSPRRATSRARPRPRRDDGNSGKPIEHEIHEIHERMHEKERVGSSSPARRVRLILDLLLERMRGVDSANLFQVSVDFVYFV